MFFKLYADMVLVKKSTWHFEAFEERAVCLGHP